MNRSVDLQWIFCFAEFLAGTQPVTATEHLAFLGSGRAALGSLHYRTGFRGDSAHTIQRAM